MKITIIHDGKGTIRSAGFATSEVSRQAELVADDNKRVVEVDTSDVKDIENLRYLGDQKHAAQQSAAWRELTGKYHIDANGKLRRK